MTSEFIALTPKMPDSKALLAALHAGGPELQLTAAEEGAVVHLCTAAGRPLVSVEAPVLVQVPGEARRLLGDRVAVPELPFWWTEVRADTAVPEARSLAESVCGRLVTFLGGTVWPRAAATTRTVKVPPDTPQESPQSSQEHVDGTPRVDVLTESTAVVVSDRPLLPLTTWLSGLLRDAAGSDRALHLVTPPQTRLTLPLRAALGRVPNRWVVQDPNGGYYDGSSGVRLSWRGGTFVPEAGVVADAFAAGTGAGPTSERQLNVSFRTVHAPDARLVLGRALEAAWRHLTGAPPTGWGTAEPVNLPWSTGQLTDLARDRAPAATHLVAVGSPDRPAVATQRIARTTAGVAEEVSLTIGYGRPDDVPLDALEPLAASLVAEHGLTTMLATVRAARADLTVPAHLEVPPVPVSLTLGPRDVRKAGLAHASRPPVRVPPRRLGPAAEPALHYPLGDGTDPGAWTALQSLDAHLRNGSGGRR
ncbi:MULTISPECIES: DUF6177 family protein [unclassified Streptomyces]|uniref:DUF6177 family protein n=1 Tax=unclassified Streptomyces TaxID=2593676 RepID=UPI003D70D48D